MERMMLPRHAYGFGKRTAILALIGIGIGCGASNVTDHSGRLSPTPLALSGSFSIAGLATVSDSAQVLSYGITVTNTGTTNVLAQYGDCWGFLHLYRAPDRSGTPAFDGGDATVACRAFAGSVLIGPNQTWRISRPTDLGFFRLHGVTAGHYYVGIRIAPNGVETIVPGGEVDFP
jgi:hypothetical protein